jgi:hypothetical protein
VLRQKRRSKWDSWRPGSLERLSLSKNVATDVEVPLLTGISGFEPVIFWWNCEIVGNLQSGVS